MGPPWRVCSEDACKGGPETERRPELSGWGTDTSTGQDARRSTIASDLCLLQGSEQVQRYSRVLCYPCPLVSMLFFHFFSCSSCTLLGKCHRFCCCYFFSVLGFVCLAPDPGVVRLELTHAFPRFPKEQSPAFWCTRLESTVFSSRPLSDGVVSRARDSKTE